MQLVIPIEDFSINNVYFNHPIPNNVLDGSLFSRIIYSDDIITFNGVYLGLRWRRNISSFIFLSNIDTNLENNNNNNNNNNDKQLNDLLDEEKDINNLCLIEEQILNRLNLSNKVKQYQVYDQIRSTFNNLKKKSSSSENNHSYIFKCSGIWISESSYGLTFKIIDSNSNSNPNLS